MNWYDDCTVSKFKNRPKMIFSLTTIPPRLMGLKRTIYNILQYNSLCDELYLNIPHLSLKGKKYDLGKDYLSFLPDCMQKKVVINRCDDLGPITKSLPTLCKVTDNNCVIVTVDDDIRFRKDASIVLMEKHLQHPNACISFSGFCVGTFPFNWQFIIDNKKDREVDWIQGVHCILFPRKIINTTRLIHWEPRMTRHDDHRISSFLASEGIKRISICYNPSEYMYGDMELARTAAISGSAEFIYQNLKISYRFKSMGLYKHNYPAFWVCSILGLVFIVIGFTLLTYYMTRKIIGYDIWFIGIYTIILGTLLFWILTSAFLI